MTAVLTRDEEPPRAELDVLYWRYDVLQRAGYPSDLANCIAARTDVDLHRACDLLRDGALPDVAVRILL